MNQSVMAESRVRLQGRVPAPHQGSAKQRLPRSEAVRRVRGGDGRPTELFVQTVGPRRGDEVAGVPRSFVFPHGVDDATAPIHLIRRLSLRRSGRRLIELTGVDHHPWLRRPADCTEPILATAGVAYPASADPSVAHSAEGMARRPEPQLAEQEDSEMGLVPAHSRRLVPREWNGRSIWRREW